MSEIRIPVSPGELIDKVTILEIKLARIDDSSKRANVALELELLRAIETDANFGGEVAELRAELKQVNEALWDAEDEIRDCEARGEFGEAFVDIARAIYKHNDRRSALKARINRLLGSTLQEEKSYVS